MDGFSAGISLFFADFSSKYPCQCLSNTQSVKMISEGETESKGKITVHIGRITGKGK